MRLKEKANKLYKKVIPDPIPEILVFHCWSITEAEKQNKINESYAKTGIQPSIIEIDLVDGDGTILKDSKYA